MIVDFSVFSISSYDISLHVQEFSPIIPLDSAGFPHGKPMISPWKTIDYPVITPRCRHRALVPRLAVPGATLGLLRGRTGGAPVWHGRVQGRGASVQVGCDIKKIYIYIYIYIYNYIYIYICWIYVIFMVSYKNI